MGWRNYYLYIFTTRKGSPYSSNSNVNLSLFLPLGITSSLSIGSDSQAFNSSNAEIGSLSDDLHLPIEKASDAQFLILEVTLSASFDLNTYFFGF